MVSIIVAVVLAHAAATGPAGPDPWRTPSQRTDLDSEELKAQVISAMILPYHYGVTQMPCRAKEWEPQRGWYPAREPSGGIRWIIGPITRVRWGGIYSTCFIQSPNARDRKSVV